MQLQYNPTFGHGAVCSGTNIAQDALVFRLRVCYVDGLERFGVASLELILSQDRKRMKIMALI